jgi:hypothetical protein
MGAGNDQVKFPRSVKTVIVNGGAGCFGCIGSSGPHQHLGAHLPRPLLPTKLSCSFLKGDALSWKEIDRDWAIRGFDGSKSPIQSLPPCQPLFPPVHAGAQPPRDLVPLTHQLGQDEPARHDASAHERGRGKVDAVAVENVSGRVSCCGVIDQFLKQGTCFGDPARSKQTDTPQIANFHRLIDGLQRLNRSLILPLFNRVEDDSKLGVRFLREVDPGC